MVDGRDWDALVRRFLFYLIRAEGFPGVCVGFLGSFFLGCRVFSLFLSFAGLLDFFFSFTCSGGSGLLSHGAGFGLGFHG